jgi:hypothetical protein
MEYRYWDVRLEIVEHDGFYRKGMKIEEMIEMDNKETGLVSKEDALEKVLKMHRLHSTSVEILMLQQWEDNGDQEIQDTYVY